jgi:hypothetical protein
MSQVAPTNESVRNWAAGSAIPDIMFLTSTPVRFSNLASNRIHETLDAVLMIDSLELPPSDSWKKAIYKNDIVIMKILQDIPNKDKVNHCYVFYKSA